jgi:hypothetical protein
VTYWGISFFASAATGEVHLMNGVALTWLDLTATARDKLRRVLDLFKE